MGGKATLRVTYIKETQMRATLIDSVTMLHKLYGELTELIKCGLRKVAEFSWRQGIFEGRLCTRVAENSLADTSLVVCPGEEVNNNSAITLPHFGYILILFPFRYELQHNVRH